MIAAILNKSIFDWTPEEAQQACFEFETTWKQPDFASPELCTALWRYWMLKHGQKDLFDKPDIGHGLMLMAQAYGEFVPPPSKDHFFGKIRLKFADKEAALSADFPSQQLRPDALKKAQLASPVLHVYLFQDQGRIQEVLIIGKGSPTHQRIISQLALACSLRTQAGNFDMVQTDCIRIVSPEAEQRLLELELIPFGHAFHLEARQGPSAIEELERGLRQLARTHGMMVIHNCLWNEQEAYFENVRSFVKKAFSEQAVYVLKKERSRSSATDFTALVPIYTIRRRPRPIALDIPASCISNTDFKELLAVYTLETVERVVEDAKARKHTYEDEAKRLTEAIKDFREEHDETMTITHRFDAPSGHSIKLSEPKEVSKSKWIKESAPWLEKENRKWATRMQKIIDDIQQTVSRPDNPIERIATARFIDAAIRGTNMEWIHDDLVPFYQKWASRIAPFLRWKWRKYCTDNNWDPNTIIQQNTFFQIRAIPNSQGSIEAYRLLPNNCVNVTSTIILCDSNKRHIEVWPLEEEFIKSTADRSNETNNVSTILNGFMNEKSSRYELIRELRRNLYQDPASTIKELTRFFQQRTDSTIIPYIQNDPIFEEARRSISRRSMPGRLIFCINNHAFQTARNLLQHPDVSSNLVPYQKTWRFIVETKARDGDPFDILQAALYLPEQIRKEDAPLVALLQEAKRSDEAFFDQWITTYTTPQQYGQAIRFLNKEWRKKCPLPKDKKILDWIPVVRSIEISNLIQSMKRQSKTIDHHRENRCTILNKVGPAFEEYLLSEVDMLVSDDVYNLWELLLGMERRTKEQ